LVTELKETQSIAHYTIDGMVPRAVTLASTEADVAAALRAAADAGEVVVPWGAGTKQDLGNPLDEVGLVLSLEQLNQVVEYVPTDMTITVQAGMRFADLQALTARHRQTVPLDPPRAAGATIGGIVATAGFGPRRTAYGAVRDLLLGARIALPDGRVIKAGGKVVKNVAGYDISKLMAGSLGTLGVITEVSLRLRPLPADGRTLLFGFAELGPALEAAEKILASELLPAAVAVITPRAARLLGAPGSWALAVALEETAENNAYQVERLSQIVKGHVDAATLTGEADRSFWDALTNYGDRFGAAFHIRVGTVISDLAAQLNACLSSDGAAGLDGIAYVASGTAMLYGFQPDGDTAAMAETVKPRFAATGAGGGSSVLESGPTALRRQFDVWGPPRPEWQLAGRIKQTFDPKRILNRGRYVGGL
jgi:glycolate oxidase FAD binding subunit